MTCIVTNSSILRQPARVLTSLASPSIFVIMPFGKADLLIIETFKPDSKRTQKSLRLLMVPIVSAVQIVRGILVLESWSLVHGSWLEVCHPQSHSIHIQRPMRSQQRNWSCWRVTCPMWRGTVFSSYLKAFLWWQVLTGSCVSTRISNLTWLSVKKSGSLSGT